MKKTKYMKKKVEFKKTKYMNLKGGTLKRKGGRMAGMKKTKYMSKGGMLKRKMVVKKLNICLKVVLLAGMADVEML